MPNLVLHLSAAKSISSAVEGNKTNLGPSWSHINEHTIFMDAETVDFATPKVLAVIRKEP